MYMAGIHCSLTLHLNSGFTWAVEVPSIMPQNAHLEVAEIHISIREIQCFQYLSLLKASGLKAISCISLWDGPP